MKISEVDAPFIMEYQGRLRIIKELKADNIFFNKESLLLWSYDEWKKPIYGDFLMVDIIKKEIGVINDGELLFRLLKKKCYLDEYMYYQFINDIDELSDCGRCVNFSHNLECEECKNDQLVEILDKEEICVLTIHFNQEANERINNYSHDIYWCAVCQMYVDSFLERYIYLSEEYDERTGILKVYFINAWFEYDEYDEEEQEFYLFECKKVAEVIIGRALPELS